jgi:hypothetical protein
MYDEKRAYNRIPVYLHLKFFFGNSLCSGTAINLSEKGLCFTTSMFLTPNSKIDIILSNKDTFISIPIRVVWIENTDSFFDTVGVEVLDTSKDYMELIDNLRTTH